MRSPLASAVGALLAMSVLAGCSGGDDDDAATTSTTEAVTETTLGTSTTIEAPTPTETTLGDSSVTEPPAAEFPAGFPADDVIFPTDYDLIEINELPDQRYAVIVAAPSASDAVLTELLAAYPTAGWTTVEQGPGDDFITGTATFEMAGWRVAIIVEPAEAATAVTYEITLMP